VNANEPILELLARWEEQAEKGLDPTPPELCPDRPELWPDLERRISRRRKLRVMLAVAAEPSTEAAPAAVLLPGYEQFELLGKGGMGEVYKAFDPRLKRWVALKQVRLDRARPDRLVRFRREAEALAKLDHPHIVKVHEYAERDGQPVLVMEHVGGGTLEQRLKQGPLRPAEAARLVAILAWAVHAAHEKGIVHRDLKPANVLMAAPVEGNVGR
jgi:serine/threonine-protein kinase